LCLLLRSSDQRACSLEQLPPPDRMIHLFQPKVSHNWHKHADGFQHVTQASLAACGGHRRAPQVVKPENMHGVEILQPRPAVALHGRVPAHRAVTQPRRHVNRLHAILSPPPAKWRSFRCDFFLLRLQPLFQAPVGRKNRYLVAPPRQSLGKCAHLHRWAAEFKKRIVRFRNVQDSHWSRRIFFRVLAKALKRNSFSARCWPRAPISFACAGSASSASIDVASWIGSPCGTRYPVTPSSMISGAPPCAPPMTGLPQAIASRYTSPNPSPRLGKA